MLIDVKQLVISDRKTSAITIRDPITFSIVLGAEIISKARVNRLNEINIHRINFTNLLVSINFILENQRVHKKNGQYAHFTYSDCLVL